MFDSQADTSMIPESFRANPQGSPAALACEVLWLSLRGCPRRERESEDPDSLAGFGTPMKTRCQGIAPLWRSFRFLCGQSLRALNCPASFFVGALYVASQHTPAVFLSCTINGRPAGTAIGSTGMARLAPFPLADIFACPAVSPSANASF